MLMIYFALHQMHVMRVDVRGAAAFLDITHLVRRLGSLLVFDRRSTLLRRLRRAGRVQNEELNSEKLCSARNGKSHLACYVTLAI